MVFFSEPLLGLPHPGHTAQKMMFSIKDFVSNCDQIRRNLRIWSHLLKKSLMENFIFCAVLFLTFEWNPDVEVKSAFTARSVAPTLILFSVLQLIIAYMVIEIHNLLWLKVTSFSWQVAENHSTLALDFIIILVVSFVMKSHGFFNCLAC